MVSESVGISDSAKAIGGRIVRERERLGLTQKELADRIGSSEQSVSLWERGVSVPGRENFPKLVELFRTTESALRYGSPPTPLRVSESVPTHSLGMGRAKLPPRAYERVYEYLERMRAAQIPDEMIEESERLMVDPLYSKINKRDIRERSEEDLITDIDAAWSWIREVVEREWGKQLR